MKMKVLILVIILLTGLSTGFTQEQGTSKIKLGYGLESSNSLLDITTSLTGSTLSLGTVRYDDLTGTGTLYVGYEYAVIDRLMIGATIAYETNKEDMFVGDSNIGTVSHNHISFGLDANYYYISSEMFQMYSGIGVAYTIQSDKYDGDQSGIEDGKSSYFNFQLNAVGFRYGSAFGVFAELGFGYKGIINAGISYQF
jgi:outer membrane protein W